MADASRNEVPSSGAGAARPAPEASGDTEALLSRLPHPAALAWFTSRGCSRDSRGDGFVLIQPAAKAVVEVFAKARRERIFDCEHVVPASVGLALGSEEEGGTHALAAEALGEVKPVGYEEHLDLRVQQGADNLVADLRSLSFIGPGEGFVEQHEAVRPDLVGDGVMRLSSSSSRPLTMPGSSCRMKWVKIP